MNYSRILIKFFLIILACSMLCVVSFVLQRSWYGWVMQQPLTTFPLSLKWQTTLGDGSYDHPVYHNGDLFLPIDRSWYSLDAQTGQVNWSRDITRQGIYRCITSNYLVLGGPWVLVVMDISTGKIVWEMDRPGGGIACHQNTIFSTSYPRDPIAAYDLDTGEQLWFSTIPFLPFYTLIYDKENNILIGNGSPDRIHRVDPLTRRILTSYGPNIFGPTNRGSESFPVILLDQGELFLGGTVLDATTGRVIHQDTTQGEFAPTLTSDTMYLPTFTGVKAFDRTDYSVQWVYPYSSIEPLAPIAILDDIGYTVFSDATVRAFSLDTGKELGYWQLPREELGKWPVCVGFWISGLMCNGSATAGVTTSEEMLFVSFGNGQVYAFGAE